MLGAVKLSDVGTDFEIASYNIAFLAGWKQILAKIYVLSFLCCRLSLSLTDE